MLFFRSRFRWGFRPCGVLLLLQGASCTSSATGRIAESGAPDGIAGTSDSGALLEPDAGVERPYEDGGGVQTDLGGVDEAGPSADSASDGTEDDSTGSEGVSEEDGGTLLEPGPSACTARYRYTRSALASGAQLVLSEHYEVDERQRLVRGLVVSTLGMSERTLEWDEFDRLIFERTDVFREPTVSGIRASPLFEETTFDFAGPPPSRASVKTSVFDHEGDGIMDNVLVETFAADGNRVHAVYRSEDGTVLQESQETYIPEFGQVTIWSDFDADGVAEIESVITEQNGLVTEIETRDSSNGPLTTSRIRVRYDALGRPVESTHDRDDDGIFEFRTVYEWTDATRFTEFNFHDGSETPVEWLRVERDGVTGARRILGFVIEAECRSSLTIRLPNSALTVESLVDTTGYDDCLDAWRNGARSKATYEVLTQGLKRVMQRTDDDADGQFESFTEWSYLPEGHTNTIQHTEVDGTAVTRSLDEAFVTRDNEGRLLSYEFRSEFAPWHSGEYRFSYDAAGNVVSEYRENGPPSERRRRTLGFQAWDERNRLTGAAGFTLGDPDDTVYSVVEYTGPFPFSRCDVPVP